MGASNQLMRSSEEKSRFLLLDPDQIVSVIERLDRRISERFPSAGLRRVSSDLLAIAHRTRQQLIEVGRPIIPLRLVSYTLVGVIVAGLCATVFTLDASIRALKLTEFIQVLEAGINDIVLIGAGIYILFSFERRIKRQRALRYLDQLRSVAHIIDMHQLTKDPERIRGSLPRTLSSPERSDLTPYELGRYLDYCTELLSLVNKLAALYAQGYDDGVVLGSVNEVETLTNALSRQIWQKLMILALDDSRKAEG